MKFVCLILLMFSSALMATGQSGRVKPEETPTPGVLVARPVSPPVRRSDRPRNVQPTLQDDDGGVITVDSNLVPIPTSVFDASGRVLNNLKLNDFDLKIDGVPVEISELSRSETGINVAMLFDNSSSVKIAGDFERAAAIKFFRRMIRPDKDLAALFSVSGATRLEQRFTRDVSTLVRAIEGFPPPGGGTALLDGIITAAEYLNGVPGRRVLVIVSDGDDTMSDATLEATLKALQISNCQVFVVKTTDFENYMRTKSRNGNANIRQLTAERRMLEIATQTGGAVYSPVDEKELEAAFRQIAAEFSQQYILSYYPDDDSGKVGQFRSIDLAVKGRKDAIVRTRKGYYVPKPRQ